MDAEISIIIFVLYRVIVAVGKHVVAYHTLTCCCVLVRGYKPANLGVIVACLQVIQACFRIVVVATIAEGVLGAYRVCGGVLELHELAPSIVGVGYDEFAGGGVGKGYYITLYIVDVIVEVVVAVGHADTVTLLVVEEAEGLAVGRLGENLRAVEQVLGRICAVTLAGSDAFRIVSKGNCFILFQPL